MICVYPADCSDFSTNGNGALAPLSGGGHGNAERRIRTDAGASD